MSLSLITAIILQDNEIRCVAMGPFSNGKYGSVAYLMQDKQAVEPVISIQKGQFSTCKEAIDKLDSVIEFVRDLNLSSEKEKLEGLLEDV